MIINVYYDFRSLGSYANQISSTEISLSEQALHLWADASQGRLNFIRNTTAPATDIIDIGLGDLAALGAVSAPRGILALGGGTFATLGSQQIGSLNLIMAEWRRTGASSLYATRIANLRDNGVGTDGTTKLNSTTVQNDTSDRTSEAGSPGSGRHDQGERRDP